MSDNIHYLEERFKNAEKFLPHPDRHGGSGGGGGGTGGGDFMEKRIESIEKSLPEIKERLARVETKIDSIKKHMVTKADLLEETGGLNQAIANFRTDIQSLETRLLKWFVGTAAALSAVAFGVARLIH